MLKNDPIPASPTSPDAAAAAFLPLQGLGSAIKTIAVIGPNADNSHSQQGGYTNEGAAVVTVLDAAVAAANASGNAFKIEYERGACVGATPGCDCPVLPDPAAPLCGIFNTSRVPTAAAVAAAADVVVLVLGDSSTIMATGTCLHHVRERVQIIAHCGSLLNCTIPWRCHHCIVYHTSGTTTSKFRLNHSQFCDKLQTVTLDTNAECTCIVGSCGMLRCRC